MNGENNIETELINKYNNFIKTKSIFKDIVTILPDTPQSFSDFPTIIFKLVNDTDNINISTMNYLEYGDDLTFQVEIYTKDVVVGKKKYVARNVVNELKELTHEFFRNMGIRRTSSARGEYIDINVKRHIMIFTATMQSWNKYIF